GGDGGDEVGEQARQRVDQLVGHSAFLAVNCALSCPHAAETSSPLRFRTMTGTPQFPSAATNRSIFSCEGDLYGTSSTLLNGITFTFILVPAIFFPSSRACFLSSFTPSSSTYSNVTFFPVACSPPNPALMMSMRRTFFIVGTTSPRIASLGAWS